ncbi:hypothetical protein K490DRAFT_58553 [Saccharata proteae CBS 121410]|uniref:F-box domain-containing protein n=1 Tax=Saccharata proteae CBS 121410 TaxID=1314787 RepID=A0A9P4LV64_9PEZI|nr:hypothetical protein K490DRAFT_58553 [Saccharata proteae CBS 121410]
MNINDFPYEILSLILEWTASLNERDGVSYTFGLSQAPQPMHKAPLQRYLRGPLPPDMLRWDSVSPLRGVCSKWHEWALSYAVKDVFIRKWRGSERWAELSSKRENYNIYELIEKPSGAAVYRDPYCSLRVTVDFLSSFPAVAAKIRRMWFHGFYVSETDVRMFAALNLCNNLRTASIPWTMVRHLDAKQWHQLLRADQECALESLQLQAVVLPQSQARDPSNQIDLRPLQSEFVDFSRLKSLRLFGNTTHMPLDDEDLKAISRTATNLEVFDLTCLSTVTIDGVMAIVKASQSTLRVLEHSPRSNDGFFHPHPGTPSSDDHLCEILSNCPRLETLSISVPSMCATLFANDQVRWSGDCQVRATRLCDHDHDRNQTANEAASESAVKDPTSHNKLALLLHTARHLATTHRSARVSKHLSIELFFAAFIFEPHLRLVHGDLAIGELNSGGLWPVEREPSRKGPYGSTGLYGKDEEEGVFEMVGEREFLRGWGRGWVGV